MSLYAIGDLHLSFGESVEKPMDIYGGLWVDHARRVRESWTELVGEEDTVIVPGDISWGLKLSEAAADLEWISRLPGRKVLIKGNHDLWWSSLTKLSGLFPSLHFLQNQCLDGGDFIICGSRGWTCPGESDFTAQDKKIYERELGRLRLSLEAGRKALLRADEEGRRPKLVGALHYPPTNEKMLGSGFTDLFEEYGACKVVYGHLHGSDAFRNGLQGTLRGVEYILASCDKLRCVPVKLMD